MEHNRRRRDEERHAEVRPADLHRAERRAELRPADRHRAERRAELRPADLHRVERAAVEAPRARPPALQGPEPDIAALADDYYETGEGLQGPIQSVSLRPGGRPPRLSSDPAPSTYRPQVYETEGWDYENGPPAEGGGHAPVPEYGGSDQPPVVAEVRPSFPGPPRPHGPPRPPVPQQHHGHALDHQASVPVPAPAPEFGMDEGAGPSYGGPHGSPTRPPRRYSYIHPTGMPLGGAPTHRPSRIYESGKPPGGIPPYRPSGDAPPYRPPNYFGAPLGMDPPGIGPPGMGPPGLVGMERPPKQPLGHEIILYFFYMRHGKSVPSNRRVRYITGDTRFDDRWFARTVQNQYKLIREPITLKGIGFVHFFRYEQDLKNHQWRTAKEPIIPYTGPRSTSHFKYLLRYPQHKARKFTGKLDKLYQTAADPNCFITIEIVEGLDTIKIYWGLGTIILLSLATALSYALIKGDISGGFTIASYVVGCLALIGALLAAGEWFGLDAPDSFAFQHDLETGDAVSNDELGRFVGTRIRNFPR